jgi:hypothetical protein
MPSKPLTEIAASVFNLLEPLAKEDRQRVVKAVYALLGESPSGLGVGDEKGKTQIDVVDDQSQFGPKARQWLLKHQLPREKLEKAFYFQDGKVDIHLNTMVGGSKKEQTINCYLLLGAKAFLESDNSQFSDSDAIALCKHVQAYDKNNHTTNRSSLGNMVTGSRQEGFALTGPGLKAAAELLLSISSDATTKGHE